MTKKNKCWYLRIYFLVLIYKLNNILQTMRKQKINIKKAWPKLKPCQLLIFVVLIKAYHLLVLFWLTSDDFLCSFKTLVIIYQNCKFMSNCFVIKVLCVIIICSLHFSCGRNFFVTCYKSEILCEIKCYFYNCCNFS